MSNLANNYSAQPKTTQILDGFQKTVGTVPNIYRLIGHSPNVLEGFMAFNNCLSKGTLSQKCCEQIALAVAGYNKCEYCASAHAQIAKKCGISTEEVQRNLGCDSEDTKTRTLLQFVQKVCQTKGCVSDSDLSQIRSVGFSDEQVVEIVGCIGINIFTNYFNGVARTELDFPKVSF